MPHITLIAAVAANRVIGNRNTLPWHLPEDFAFFKRYTLGKSVIMGRKTWDSLPKKPLPERRNLVITRQNGFQAAGAEVFADLTAALAACNQEAEIIIMGGAEIYAQALPLATDLRLTEVGLQPEGDAFFPEFSAADWQQCSRQQHTAANGTTFAFVHWQRKAA